MNELLSDAGSPRLRLVDLESLPRGQGGTDFAAPDIDIREFRVFDRGVVPGFEDAAGLARCGDTEAFGRVRCQLDLVMENIQRASEITGSSVADITKVVALHELGHALCIQHRSQDPTRPSAGPVFTAMNNFMLTDADNPATRYFTLDPTEVANVREATQSRPPPGTVFSGGFNTD